MVVRASSTGWLPRVTLGARIALGIVAACAASTLLAGQAEARTEPFEGLGEAPRVSGASARRQALQRARDAALDTALEQLEISVDPAARDAVLARADGWTGAYRILDEQDDGETVRVKVEVDVDLARLRKALTPRVGPRAKGFRLGPVDVAGGCREGGVDDRRVTEHLRREGLIVAGSGAVTLTLGVTCEDAGAVPFTFLSAARFSARAEVEGMSAPLEISAFGYGDDVERARADAAARGLSALAARLAERARGGVVLHVAGGWPSSRVRHLETRIEQAMVGVAGVTLDGIDADGSVRIHLDTDLRATTVEPRLRTLELEGFQVGAIRVDSEHALFVQLR